MYWPTLFGQDDRILNKSFAFSPKIKENIQLSQSSANPLGQYRISLAGQTREIPTGKTGLLCPLGEPIETIDSLQLAHVRTGSRLSNKGTYPHWCVCGEERCLMTQKLGWFYLVPMRHYFTYANRKARLRRSKYILLNSTGSNTLLIMSPTQ